MKELKNQRGKEELDNVVIHETCEQMFKDEFITVLMQNSPIPNRNGYFIINTDCVGGKGLHWMCFIKVNKNIYVYDSFGRLSKNMLPLFTKKMTDQGYTIHNTDTYDADQHGYTSVDCGHRCIASLMIYHKLGLKAYMSL